MKKIFRAFRLKHIDIFIYRLTEIDISKKVVTSLDSEFIEIKQKKMGKKTLFFLYYKSEHIHTSEVLHNIFTLKSISKANTPVIGNCVTNKSYRGQSIYPFMLQHISKGLIAAGHKEVFIIVDSDNHASIRGIEKACFKTYCSMKAKRIGPIYLSKTVNYL